MTRQLILMRHAKSDWDDPALSDHDRPLNPRGRRDAPKIGAWLHARGFVPDVALVSSARRTQETWEYLLPILGGAIPMQSLPGLYHADADAILAHLRAQTAPTVLVIGHNPGIGDCASRLLDRPLPHPRFLDYPTGATLVADGPDKDWAMLDWRSAQAVDFTVPREL